MATFGEYRRKKQICREFHSVENIIASSKHDYFNTHDDEAPRCFETELNKRELKTRIESIVKYQIKHQMHRLEEEISTIVYGEILKTNKNKAAETKEIKHSQTEQKDQITTVEKKSLGSPDYETADGQAAFSGYLYALVVAQLLSFLAYIKGFKFQVALEYKPGGKFDDIMFKFKNQVGDIEEYLFQLKKKGENTDSKIIELENLFPNENKNTKCPFDLKMYLKHFKPKSNDTHQAKIVLFTNAKLEIKGESLSTKILIPAVDSEGILTYNPLSEKCLQYFHEKLSSKSVTKLQIETFLKQLHLAFSQKNFNTLNGALKDNLTANYGKISTDIYNFSFMFLINQLRSKKSKALSSTDLDNEINRLQINNDSVKDMIEKKKEIRSYDALVSANECNILPEVKISEALKLEHEKTGIDLAIVGPPGSGKDMLISSYLSNVSTILRFQHIISLNAETENSLHVSICDVARRFMLHSDCKNNTEPLTIAQILNNIFNFVDNGNVLIIFNNAGTFLCTSDDGPCFANYIPQNRELVNFYYIVTSSQITGNISQNQINLNEYKEQYAMSYLQLVNKSETYEENSLRILENHCQNLDYNLVAIQLALGLAENTQEEVKELLQENVIAVDSIIYNILNMIITQCYEKLNVDLFYKTLFFLAISNSKNVPLSLYSTLLTHDNHAFENIIKVLAKYQVIMYNSGIISLHPLIGKSVMQILSIEESLKYFQSLIVNTKMKDFIDTMQNDIQMILSIWESLLQFGLENFNINIVSEFAYKLCSALKENYNLELYLNVSSKALAALKYLAKTKYTSLLNLQHLITRVSIGDKQYVMAQLEQIEFQNFTSLDLKTEMVILLLKLELIEKLGNELRQIMLTLQDMKVNKETVSDVERFLHVCYIYCIPCYVSFTDETFQKILHKYETYSLQHNRDRTVLGKLNSLDQNKQKALEFYEEKTNTFMNKTGEVTHEAFESIIEYVDILKKNNQNDKSEKISKSLYQKINEKFGPFHHLTTQVLKTLTTANRPENSMLMETYINEREHVLKTSNHPKIEKQLLNSTKKEAENALQQLSQTIYFEEPTINQMLTNHPDVTLKDNLIDGSKIMEDTSVKYDMDAIDKDEMNKQNTTQMFKEAKELFEAENYSAALALFEKITLLLRDFLGEDHADTIQTMFWTAKTLDKLERSDESLQLLEQVLEKRRRVLGDDHEDTMRTIHDIGYLLNKFGRYSEALEFYTEAVERRTRVLGPDHAGNLRFMYNKADTLEKLGRDDEALQLYKILLEKRRRVLGDDHEDTMRTIHDIGYLLNKFGRYSEALEFYTEAVERRTQVLGPDHAGNLRFMYNKAYTLERIGRDDEALQLYKIVLEKRRRVLGDDHEDTMRTIHELGYLLHKFGRYSEALEYITEAVERRTRLLGPDHADTLLSMFNKADTVKKLGSAAHRKRDSSIS